MLPLNATAHRVVSEIVKNAPLSPGKVEFAWRAAVGPAVARATRVRLGADGVLDVQAAGEAWAVEVRRSANLIGARLAALLGDGVITRIRAHHA